MLFLTFFCCFCCFISDATVSAVLLLFLLLFSAAIFLLTLFCCVSTSLLLPLFLTLLILFLQLQSMLLQLFILLQQNEKGRHRLRCPGTGDGRSSVRGRQKALSLGGGCAGPERRRLGLGARQSPHTIELYSLPHTVALPPHKPDRREGDWRSTGQIAWWCKPHTHTHTHRYIHINQH